jgi:hypothetical protein
MACHIRALVLEEAQIQIPANLEPYMDENGNINASEVAKLVSQIQQALGGAKQRALEVFGEFDWVTEDWVWEAVKDFPQKVQETIELRARAVEQAVKEMLRYATKVGKTAKEKQLAEGYEKLALMLRSDRDYAYLPRVLAEAGLLPGYAFPPIPGALHLGYQPEPIYANRLQAQ